MKTLLQSLFSTNLTYHDSVDNVIGVCLQSLDSLVSRNIGLRHDQFNVLVLDTSSINFLIILDNFLDSSFGSLFRDSTWSREFLSSRGLGQSTRILKLCLSNDNVGIIDWVLVNFWSSNGKDGLNMKG